MATGVHGQLGIFVREHVAVVDIKVDTEHVITHIPKTVDLTVQEIRLRSKHVEKSIVRLMGHGGAGNLGCSVHRIVD
jgi:hypothetical protein